MTRRQADTATRAILERRERARAAFIRTVAELLGPDADKAAAAVAGLIAAKAAKFDGDRYTVKHGAFLDRDVLLRAAELA